MIIHNSFRLREYARSESERSFDEVQMRRARLQSLGLAYLSPQNKSLAQSFRYMRNKPTIIAFKTPSLENCDSRTSILSIGDNCKFWALASCVFSFKDYPHTCFKFIISGYALSWISFENKKLSVNSSSLLKFLDSGKERNAEEGRPRNADEACIAAGKVPMNTMNFPLAGKPLEVIFLLPFFTTKK